MKHFIRDVDRTWNSLLGEVELDDLIVLTALRHGALKAFDFIVANIDEARIKPRHDNLVEEAVKTLRSRWETLRDSMSNSQDIQTLVDALDLEQLSGLGGFRAAASSPQGVHNTEPADHFRRVLAGQLLPGEVRDQTVLRDLELWKSSREPSMLQKLLEATPESDRYVDSWEHYAGRLSVDELIELTSEIIAKLVHRFGADATMEHPAMLAAWRRCNRRVEKDSRTDWLIDQGIAVLRVSLGLAGELFYYWASVSHGIVSEQGRAQVRGRLVDVARASLTDADTLLSSLGTQHEYPLTRFIFPPPTDEPQDTVALSSWGWLVDIIVEAAEKAPNRILPDVAVLVADTAHGIRSGRFEERYRLKREWMTEIFGPRTREMLALMARYDGDHEYAKYGRDEASRWLAEPTQSDASEDPTNTPF